MSQETRKLAAIMFTDIVGYSSLTHRDESLALALLDEHQRLLRAIFARHRGREIKSTGDGFLVEFESALGAIHAALEIQAALAERNASTSAEHSLRARVGLHLGDVVMRDGDIFGEGVNIASRLEQLADPGGICLSRAVYEQIHNKLDVPLEALGQQSLKNIAAPVEVYRVALDSAERRAPPPAPARRGWRSPRLWATGAVLAAVIAVAAWQWWPSLPGKRLAATSSAPAVATGPSIAVLPFVNMSPEASDEYLSDGMTEELITVLSKIGGLHVAARTSSSAFKGRNEDVEAIGRRLRVATVLEGSVRKSGDRVRITAQLINVTDGYHLWSEAYDRDLADIFAIQTEVAQRVAEALQIELGVGEKERIRKPATENPEAHQLYLKGRYYTSRFTRESMRKGRDYFQQAIDLDPSYAPAYLGLAYYYFAASDYSLAPREAMPKAAEAARKALELDPGLAEAHAYIGWVQFAYEWNWATAEEEFRRAIEAQPNSATGHQFYCLFLMAMGRWDEGIAEGRRAVELDPLSPEVTTMFAYGLLARDPDRAIAQLRESVEMEPQYWYSRVILARAYASVDRFDEAIAEAQAARAIEDETEVAGVLGWALTRAGRRDEALQVVDGLIERSRREYVSPYFIAMIYAGLGDNDRAFEWLDKTVAERSYFPAWVQAGADLEQLRGDPRFAEMARKVGLPAR